MKELFDRIENSEIHELIMATNPNIEGEATVMYIRENLPKKGKDVNITRLSK
jgi:recombination protein RecR